MKRISIPVVVVIITGIVVLGSGSISGKPAMTSQVFPVLEIPTNLASTPTNIFLTVQPTTDPTQRPTTHPAQIEVFEELWSTVKIEYLYPDFNGLDWDLVYQEYQRELLNGVTDQDFYQLMKEMINQLDDDHSYYLDPFQVIEQNAAYSGSNTFIGIGVTMKAIPAGSNAIVLVTYEGSSADRMGIQVYDRIIQVDGQAIVDANGSLKSLIDGPRGSVTELVVQTPGEPPRTVHVPRTEIKAQIPIPSNVRQTTAGKRIGYLSLISFADRTIPNQLSDVLEYMTQYSNLDGLIIDIRWNQGGTLSVLQEALSFFISGKLGYFSNRVRELPFYINEPQSIGNSQTVPLVILIGPDTISYGEVFAGVLQDSGRALLIGESTAGNIESLWGFDFDDGSRAWIAHDTFIPYNNPDVDWEETGIEPDIIIHTNWNLITRDSDPVLQAALKTFD